MCVQECMCGCVFLRTLYISQPLRLPVMFRGDGQSVEENQEDDQPVENLRLDRCPALPPTQPVPPARISTEGEEADSKTER